MPQRLAAQAQTFDQVLIAGLILAFDIVEQFAAGRDHFQKATATVVVFLMSLEVFCQRRDARGQDGDLYFWRSCVAFFSPS